MAFLGTSQQGTSRIAEAGEQLGSGIGKGLNALLEGKLQNLQQKQAEKDFMSMGYDANAAKLFARYHNNPQILKLIQNYQSPDQGENQNQVAERDYLEQFQHPQQQQQMQQPQMQDFEQVLQSLRNPMGFAQARMGQVPFQPQASQQMQEQPQREIAQQPREQLPRNRPPQFGTKNKAADIQELRLAQAEIRPIIQERQKNSQLNNMINRKAKEALKNLQEHKEEFPGQFAGTVLPNWAYSDPNVRKYLADISQLVKWTAGLGDKGQITNAKIRLQGEAKANLSQPIETQEQILKDLINDTDIELEINKDLGRWRKEPNNHGMYPGDTFDRINERYAQLSGDVSSGASKNESWGSFSDYPASKYAGQKLEAENGEVFVSNGKTWVKQ